MSVVILFSLGASAGTISNSNYSLQEVTGSLAWGYKDNNAVSELGYVDNANDVLIIEQLLSDGLDNSRGSFSNPAPQGPGPQGATAIYNFGNNGNTAAALLFDFNSTTRLDSLIYSSSRAFGGLNAREVSVDVFSNGIWSTVATSNPAAFRSSDGPILDFSLQLGGVAADQLRFRWNGPQISIHEISLQGPVSVPSPPTLSLALLGLLLIRIVKKSGLPLNPI